MEEKLHEWLQFFTGFLHVAFWLCSSSHEEVELVPTFWAWTSVLISFINRMIESNCIKCKLRFQERLDAFTLSLEILVWPWEYSQASLLVLIVKAMVLPVVMYRCKSWTIKKAEHQKIDAFELWCWRRLLRVPWTTRGSNQSILKEINPEYPLEGLLLKPKLQYVGYLMQSANLLEKTLMLGKIEGKRRRGQQMMWWLDNITDSMHINLSKLWHIVEDR